MSIEAGIETVLAATDNERMKSHIICGTCYPDGNPPMGTPSLCGEKVLGTKPPPGALKCEECPKCRFEHYFKYHALGGR